MKVVTIKFEGNKGSFDCRGQAMNICYGCRLRFKCLTQLDEIIIPQKTVEKYKLGDDIIDIIVMAQFLFGEGKVKYNIIPQTTLDYNGEKYQKLVARLE